MPLCWQFNSLKNKYLVVWVDSSTFVFVGAEEDAVVATLVDDEHSNDLKPDIVSLGVLSLISDAILVSCGPMNACNSS